MDLVGKYHVPQYYPCFNKCKMELNSFTILGIRRKRMKGDTWEYKKICEEIFKKAKL